MYFGMTILYLPEQQFSPSNYTCGKIQKSITLNTTDKKKCVFFLLQYIPCCMYRQTACCILRQNSFNGVVFISN